MRRNTPDNEAYFAADDSHDWLFVVVLIAWNERRAEEVMRIFKDIVMDVVSSFVIDDQSRLQNNAEFLGEWLTEYLEEI